MAIVAAALDNDAERIVSLSRAADQVDIALIALTAEALVSTEGLSSAIAAYRRAIERHPLFAGLHLRLALHLQQASHLPTSGSMPATLREARSAALAARDLWRQWRGPSGDIQIPVLDEHLHDQFLDAITTALNDSEAH